MDRVQLLLVGLPALLFISDLSHIFAPALDLATPAPTLDLAGPRLVPALDAVALSTAQ